MKRLGAALGLATALVACSGGDKGPLAIYAGEWNGDDALYVGAVTRDGDCLTIDDGSPGGRHTLAFAAAASWDEKTQTVRWATGSVRVGDPAARVGGSTRRLDKVDWIRPPATECATPIIWAVNGN